MVIINVYDAKTGEYLNLHHVNEESDCHSTYIGRDVVYSEVQYSNPIIDNGNLREMTDIEAKLANRIPLSIGEYIKNGIIKSIESPSKLHSWDYDKKEWYLDEAKVVAASEPSEEDKLASKVTLLVLEVLDSVGE